METRILAVVFALLGVWANLAHAQRCAEDFAAIDESCVRSKESKFTNAPIPLTQEMVGSVYFYTTNLGHAGKLKVVSVSTDKERSTNERRSGAMECSMNFEASTFLPDRGAHTPDSTLSIKAEYNVWQQDSVGLDRNGPYDLRLERDGDKCVLRPVGAKMAFHAKGAGGSLQESGSVVLYTAALLLIGLAVFLVSRATLEEESKFKASEALEEAETDRRPKSQDFILKYSRPFFKRYFTPIVMGMKGRQNLKAKYRRRLANAGLIKELSPEDFFAFKLFLIIGFPILFIILRVLLEETWDMSLIPFLAVLGFFFPNLWLDGRITARKEEMIREMPFIVDMLALSVEAGLDFMAAIQKVIDRAPPSPLVEEFETMIRETRIGSSRAEGLRQLSWRTDALPINSFCATLIAADSVGASIGPILKQLSVEMRQKRSAEAEKKGATAATKILFPMILFIMPAVLIAIASPMVMRFVAGG